MLYFDFDLAQTRIAALVFCWVVKFWFLIKKPVSDLVNTFASIAWEKFKNEKILWIIKHIRIAATKPKNKLKFTIKNSKLFNKK